MTPVTKPAQNPVQGLLWMLAQTTSMCAMMACVRYLSFDGFSGPQLVFFRAFVGFLFLLPWLGMTLRREAEILVPPEWRFILLRGFIGVVGVMAWFYALTGMPVSDVVAVQFTHPLFVVIGAALILRETVGIWRWGAVAAGFAGALIIIRPGYVPFDPLVLCVLLSAMSNASVQLITKHFSLRVSGAVMILYMNIVMALVALGFSIPYWIWPDWSHLLWILAIGATGTMAHLFLARGMRLADASLLGPVDFMRLPIASAFGWVLFNEWSDLWTWVGASIIFVAVMVITRRETRTGAR